MNIFLRKELVPYNSKWKEMIDTFLDDIRRQEEGELTERIISILESKGYKITRPPKQIKDEYTFDNAWNLYQKKVGDKDKLRRKWNSMSFKDRKAATEYIPSYVLSKADKQYRLNFQTFLNQKRWNDELIGAVPPPESKKQSSITRLIDKTECDIRNDRAGVSVNEERDRLLGMVRIVTDNPKSSARKSLEGYYQRGVLQRLGINWKP